MDGGGATFSTGSGYTLGGTIGQPDAGALSGGGTTLGGGFWQPSCIAAAVDVTIALDGETVSLSWAPNAANKAYRSTGPPRPTSSPGSTLRAWVAAGPWPDPDSPVAVGDPGLNYYYLVRPTCGASYVDAGRAGEFELRPDPENWKGVVQRVGRWKVVHLDKGGITMVCIERLVQQIRPDKWAELAALDAKYNAIESRLGFTPKRRSRCYIGGHFTDTLVIERQWESMAAMEAAYERAFTDPEWQALGAEAVLIIANNQYELYAPLP